MLLFSCLDGCGTRQSANGTCRYDQLTRRAAALREELHTETERIINDVIKFKIHIQKGLEDYEGFVADEIEKELVNEQVRGEEVMEVDS